MNCADIYQSYLQKYFKDIQVTSLPLFQSLQATDWENPDSGIALNNFAVIQLIMAEETEDTALRQFYLELALEALKTGIEQENHYLCSAHLGIINNLIGNITGSLAWESAKLIELFREIFYSKNYLLSGLIYLPINRRNKSYNREILKQVIRLDNANEQSFYLLIADAVQGQPVFYNTITLRLLNLANKIIPNSLNIKLYLGINHIYNQQLEGLLDLHEAEQLFPDESRIIQALYLAYRGIKNQELTDYYYQYGQKKHQDNPQNLGWFWTDLPLENNFTYVKFDDNLLLAVEASFRSIVTSVILAQEDWQESEMDMWRDEIKEGMVVIDVGANVGVYTFSAAQRVGKYGKVFAIEPFSGCIECLEETKRVNKLDWVVICVGAAGETHKTVKLSLHQASELNEVIKDDSSITAEYQEVECFTLDSLMDKYQLSKVDWLKIDAEGNEIEVLQGCDRILSEFKPHILYENIAGNKSSNIPVAEFLLKKGYELFYYQPFLKQLIPISSLEELSGKLNIIAK